MDEKMKALRGGCFRESFITIKSCFEGVPGWIPWEADSEKMCNVKDIYLEGLWDEPFWKRKNRNRIRRRSGASVGSLIPWGFLELEWFFKAVLSWGGHQVIILLHRSILECGPFYEGTWLWVTWLSADEAMSEGAGSWRLSIDSPPYSWGNKCFIEMWSGWHITVSTRGQVRGVYLSDICLFTYSTYLWNIYIVLKICKYVKHICKICKTTIAYCSKCSEINAHG